MTKNNRPTIEMIPEQYWEKMYKELTAYFNAQRLETETLKQRRTRLMEEVGQRNEELNKVNALIEAEQEKVEKDKEIEAMHNKIPKVRKKKTVG